MGLKPTGRSEQGGYSNLELTDTFSQGEMQMMMADDKTTQQKICSEALLLFSDEIDYPEIKKAIEFLEKGQLSAIKLYTENLGELTKASILAVLSTIKDEYRNNGESTLEIVKVMETLGYQPGVIERIKQLKQFIGAHKLTITVALIVIGCTGVGAATFWPKSQELNNSSPNVERGERPANKDTGTDYYTDLNITFFEDGTMAGNFSEGDIDKHNKLYELIKEFGGIDHVNLVTKNKNGRESFLLKRKFAIDEDKLRREFSKTDFRVETLSDGSQALVISNKDLPAQTVSAMVDRMGGERNVELVPIARGEMVVEIMLRKRKKAE